MWEQLSYCPIPRSDTQAVWEWDYKVFRERRPVMAEVVIHCILSF